MKPELWTRCPSSKNLARSHCERCEGYPDHGLVRVPEGAVLIEDGFEAAVERATEALLDGRTGKGLRAYWHSVAADAMRAAVGEETP